MSGSASSEGTLTSPGQASSFPLSEIAMLRVPLAIMTAWMSVVPALALGRHGPWAAKFAQSPKMRLAAATFFACKGVRSVKAGK